MQPLIVHPVPPFSFSLTAAIFSRGDPGFRWYDREAFRHALCIGDRPVLVEVRSLGTVNEPRLAVTVHPTVVVTAALRNAVVSAVECIFSTRDDSLPFYRAMETDPVMADLVRQLRGLRAPTTPTVFEALADSVIEQQISLRAAQAIEYRLIHAVGTKLAKGEATFSCYPTPRVLADTPDHVFRACGLTTRKGEYLRGISRLIISGDFDPEALRAEPDTETIIRELVKIRGIGRWTAELTLLR